MLGNWGHLRKGKGVSNIFVSNRTAKLSTKPCANFVPERNLVEQKINELRALV
jgi:hypothetical protein